jgi:hypothetical protein
MASLQTTQVLDAPHLPVPDGSSSPQPEALHVNIWVRDPEVVATLSAHPEGRSRDDLARSGLKIGILAIQQAQGRIDSETLRKEGERLIEARDPVEQSPVADGPTDDYTQGLFDPHRPLHRIERLVKDGDRSASCGVRWMQPGRLKIAWMNTRSRSVHPAFPRRVKRADGHSPERWTGPEAQQERS